MLGDISAAVSVSGTLIRARSGVVTYRSTGTVAQNSNSAALTPGAPAGKAVGDLLILYTGTNSNTATLASLAPDWKQVASVAFQEVWVRIADGTAADTPSPDWTLTSPSFAWIEAYSGEVFKDVNSIVMDPAVLITGTSAGFFLPVAPISGNGALVVGFGRKGKTQTSDDATTISMLRGPTNGALGTAVNSATDLTVDWPTHSVGDVGILIIESAGAQAANLGTAAGFQAITNSPVIGTNTRLTAYWCRATSNSMPSPIITAPGDHAYAQIIKYSDVIRSGDPVDVSASSVKNTASTSASAPSVTTSVDNCLILSIISRETDSAAAAFSAQADASLTAIAEISDAGTTTGNGGGFSVTRAWLPTAGASGTLTATVSNSENASLTIALKPNLESGLILRSQVVQTSGSVAAFNAAFSGSIWQSVANDYAGGVGASNTAATIDGTQQSSANISGVVFSLRSALVAEIPASVSAAFAPSGVMAGAGALVGNIPVTFNADNPTDLSGAGELVGSLSAAFSASGIILGAGALVGSISANFAESGVLTGTVPVVGSISWSFAESGTLMGAGELAGNISAAFAPSGNLLGTIPVVGSISASFAATGVLLGAGALNGAVSWAFALSGLASGSGEIAGAISASLSAAGTLNGAGALAGSISATFSESGTLTGSGALVGVISAAFAPAGNLTSSTFGNISYSFSTTGHLTGAGALSGVVTGTFSGSGVLTGTSYFTGESVQSHFALTGIMFDRSAILLSQNILNVSIRDHDFRAFPRGATVGGSPAPIDWNRTDIFFDSTAIDFAW